MVLNALIRHIFNLKYFVCGLHIAIFTLTLVYNNGLPLATFALFSLTFLFLIYASLFINNQIEIKLTGLFIYLGFFTKICLHSIFKYPFSEPTGDFTGLVREWDDFFCVASVGAVAIGGFAILLDKIVTRLPKSSSIHLTESMLKFFSKFKVPLFFILLFFITTITVMNIKLGMTVSGLAAITIFPWPINALVGFSLYMGFVILICVFASLELRVFNSLKYALFLFYFEGFAVSISILSRGMFLFHVLPVLIFLFFHRKNIKMSLIRWGAVLSATMILFLISGLLVTKARSSLYDGYNLNPAEYSQKRIFSITEGDKRLITSEFLNSFLSQISRLVVDRWIGAEGVMAVVSYPDKSFELIPKTIFRTPKPGEKDVFEIINKNIYPISTKYVFTSLPGPIAFLYYSGRLEVVFVGICVLLALMVLIQQAACWIFNNEFFSYQLAFFLGITFMQFGISPRPIVVTLVMLFTVLICLRLLFMLLSRMETRWKK
jgi:hypothetical protein